MWCEFFFLIINIKHKAQLGQMRMRSVLQVFGHKPEYCTKWHYDLIMNVCTALHGNPSHKLLRYLRSSRLTEQRCKQLSNLMLLYILQPEHLFPLKHRRCPLTAECELQLALWLCTRESVRVSVYLLGSERGAKAGADVPALTQLIRPSLAAVQAVD